MKSILLFLSCLLISTPLLAESTETVSEEAGPESSSRSSGSRLVKMNFQADKNNLQVLPQRFEYTLLDDNKLKVGNILINTADIQFSVSKTDEKNNTYSLRFRWPAGLIKEGQLALKNNSGKAFFSQVFTVNDIQLSEEVVNADGLLEVYASVEFPNISSSMIDNMKYYPFMSFCIFRESYETRLYLCSQELYLSSQNESLQIRARNSTKRTPSIDINGKTVGNQGIIYLNDRNENVTFKALTQSGAFLEIETRMKDVDFKDLVLSPDGRRLIITASGAQPFSARNVRILSDNEWQISLPRTRPVLFLKGEGDIPMRQEFFIRGPLPQERNRIFLSRRAPSRTYSGSLTVAGISPSNVEVSLPESDTTAELSKGEGQRFQWSIHDIPRGKASRHYLLSKTDADTFTLGYDLFRGQAFTTDLKTQFLTPASVGYAGLGLQWWIENMMGFSQDWARFRWGLGLQYSSQVLKSDDYAEFDRVRMEILWRAQEGFYFVDRSWGIYLPIELLQGDGASLTAYGAGAFANFATQNPRWRKWAAWTELKAHYLAAGTGDIELSSAYHLEAIAYKKISESWFFSYGLILNDYKFEAAPSASEMQFGIELGLRTAF